MLLAGIQKKSLDARLRGHDGWLSDTYLCGAVLMWWNRFLAVADDRAALSAVNGY